MGQNKLHLTFKIYANKGCVAEKKYVGERGSAQGTVCRRKRVTICADEMKMIIMFCVCR